MQENLGYDIDSVEDYVLQFELEMRQKLYEARNCIIKILQSSLKAKLQ